MRSIVAVILVLAIVCVMVVAVRGFVGRAVRAVQPIAFDHTVHLEQADLECLDCHTDAETHVSAGLPGKAICLDCHDIDDEEYEPGSEKDKLFAFEESEEDIPWVRVAVTEPDVFFSHRRHVTAAGLDCLHCHPGQETLAAPPPTVQLVMTMDDCIDCHQENSASTDCLACHR